MAFFEAHCDGVCLGCEKNLCGWCIWKDYATLNSASITSNFSDKKFEAEKSESIWMTRLKRE